MNIKNEKYHAIHMSLCVFCFSVLVIHIFQQWPNVCDFRVPDWSHIYGGISV